MKKILIIVGPTATGKTDLALNLAKEFNGELVACDSRQVYQGLDIGTGKMPSRARVKVKKSKGLWQIDGINIWLYDLVDPKTQFNAFNWSNKALEVILEIESRGKLPIIVGGTGLYLKALLEGFDLSLPPDPKLREELDRLILPELQSRVVTLSPTRWEKLNQSDRNNPRRLARIIEQIPMYGYINKNKSLNFNVQNYNTLKIGLTAPRPYLNSVIDQRVFAWFNLGILQEVKTLIKRGVATSKIKEFGLEYALIADYLAGNIHSLEELIKLIQTKIKQYAKRQMTWFNKEEDVVWFDITRVDWSYRIEELVRNWYNETDYVSKN